MNSSALILTVHAVAHAHVRADKGLPLSLSCAWPKSGNTQEWKYAQDVLALRAFLEEKGTIITSSILFLTLQVLLLP